MTELARAILGVCITLTVWVMWTMVTGTPGVQFGLTSHMIGFLAGPIAGLTIFISTGN